MDVRQAIERCEAAIWDMGVSTWEHATAGIGTPELMLRWQVATEGVRGLQAQGDASAVERRALQLLQGHLDDCRDCLRAWARGELGSDDALLRMAELQDDEDGRVAEALDLVSRDWPELLARHACRDRRAKPRAPGLRH